MERSASLTVIRCRRVLSAVFMIIVKGVLMYGVSHITNPPHESFVKDVHFNLNAEINEELMFHALSWSCLTFNDNTD